jgi:hypothetical protein
MMFEIIICCVIVFAVGYWATLWPTGRREDVLHGQFVELEAEAETALPAMSTPPPKVASRPKIPSAPAKPPAKPANADELNSLLVSLKQELKNAARL